MKKIATLIFLSFCSAGVHAQAPATAKELLRHVRKQLANVGPGIAPQPAYKGTAMPERVISEARFNRGSAGLVLTDSAQFIYSGDRRSKFDFNTFEYVNLETLDNATSTDFIEIEPRPNNFDSSALPRVAFDTLHRYKLDLTGNLAYRNMELATYNADTSVANLTNIRFAGSMIDTGFRQTMTYNSAGRLSQVFDLHFDGSAWDTARIRTISYTGSGDVALDSIWIANPGTIPSIRQIYYTYNSSGQNASQFEIFFNALSGTIDTSERVRYAYYPNGQLLTATYEWNYGNGMQLDYVDSFTYTPAVPGFTGFYEKAYDQDSNLLFSLAMITNNINALQLKDSVTVTMDGIDFMSMKVLYNANGKPVLATLNDLTSGMPEAMEVRRWQYPVGAGISRTTARIDAMRIFPNPTTGTITLDHPALKAGTAISVRVTNMAGQLVHDESLNLQQAQQQIRLGSEIAPGEYMITVLDSAGNLLCNRAIMKQ